MAQGNELPGIAKTHMQSTGWIGSVFTCQGIALANTPAPPHKGEGKAGRQRVAFGCLVLFQNALQMVRGIVEL